LPLAGPSSNLPAHFVASEEKREKKGDEGGKRDEKRGERKKDILVQCNVVKIVFGRALF
jgi:hypothetical protein